MYVKTGSGLWKIEGKSFSLFNPLTPELQEMVGNERLLKIFNSYHAHMTKWLNLVSAYLGFSR